MRQIIKTDTLFLPMAGTHSISPFPVFLGGIISFQFSFLHCNVVYFRIFPFSHLFFWRAQSWETMCNRQLSTYMCSECPFNWKAECSRSSNCKCRQSSGSHMNLSAYCKSCRPMGSLRWKFPALIFANEYRSYFTDPSAVMW